ncbi:hypothetical protein JTB14_030329 [Gonioctena quinquepunctata]|nr:hypothetical protein JTB14_030329 [Gonioctena quinquepunctata]
MASLQLVVILSFINIIDGARILGIFFVPSISHQIAYQPIWKELSQRGHEVTVISPNILADPNLTNLTEIDVSFAYRTLEEFNVQGNMGKENSVFRNFLFIHEVLSKILQQQLEYEEVQKLIKGEEEFDLLLIECLHPLAFGFGARFNAPIIAVSSLQVFSYTHDIFGNPTHPVLRPDVLMSFHGEITLTDRIRSFIYSIGSRILYYWQILPQIDGVARKYFGKDMTYLGNIIRNTSLLLMNTNPIMHLPMPNVPNTIEIGQLHIREKEKLPENIKDYLDSSTNGVVYFSLGTNVKSVNLSEERREIINQALSELPFNVIWKWEADNLPGKPRNVLIKKWLPQQDILGHPNVKVFVTQGGLQSIEEAISNGVPMVGLPFFADQPINVKILVEKGLAIGVDLHTMTKEDLKGAILEVATNERFRERVHESKMILEDHPMNGLNKAIWWIEYVIRHKGAKHLRSPLADMSYFQYFMLDVVGFLLISICLFIYLLKRFFQWITESRRNKVKRN